MFPFMTKKRCNLIYCTIFNTGFCYRTKYFINGFLACWHFLFVLFKRYCLSPNKKGNTSLQKPVDFTENPVNNDIKGALIFASAPKLCAIFSSHHFPASFRLLLAG